MSISAYLDTRVVNLISNHDSTASSVTAIPSPRSKIEYMESKPQFYKTAYTPISDAAIC